MIVNVRMYSIPCIFSIRSYYFMYNQIDSLQQYQHNKFGLMEYIATTLHQIGISLGEQLHHI